MQGKLQPWECVGWNRVTMAHRGKMAKTMAMATFAASVDYVPAKKESFRGLQVGLVVMGS